MTVQPEDTEPESNRARSTPAHWASDPNFRTPERVPWSVLGPDFMEAWAGGPRDRREHTEITGPSGSGKTHFMLTVLQDRYRFDAARYEDRKRMPGAILVVTKQDDAVFSKLGWPVAHTVDEIRDTHVIFWPRTRKTGLERRAFYEHHITQLLDRAWQPNNTVLAFDEIGYVESLSGNLRVTVQQYWREGRSLGIQLVAMKQRPQGALRDMHSETAWTAVFKPKDRADAERFAELLGHRRDWLPVLDSLDRSRHEFVLMHASTEEAYISWIDTPLAPQKIRRQGLHSLVSR